MGHNYEFYVDHQNAKALIGQTYHPHEYDEDVTDFMGDPSQYEPLFYRGEGV